VVRSAAEGGEWVAEQRLVRETNASGEQAGWMATRVGDQMEHRLALVGGLSGETAYVNALENALERHLPGWTIALASSRPVEGALRIALSV